MKRVFFFLLGLSFSQAYAHSHSNVHVDSLDPVNRSYLESFCAYHPDSGLCFFTPNPPVRPTPTDPGNTNSINPGAGISVTPGLICTPNLSCTVNVNSSAALQGALNSTNCGCKIIVANGNYSGNFQLSRSCTAANPIVVQAASSGQAALSGSFSLIGNGNMLTGFRIRGSVNMIGHYTRVSRNFIEVSNQHGIVVGTSSSGVQHPTIDYNKFTFLNGGHDAIQFNVRNNHTGNNRHDAALIKGNLFTSQGSGTLQNSHAAYIATFEVNVAPINLLAEGNYFENLMTERGFYTKSPGVTYRNNTIIGGRGGLHVRQGPSANISSNWIENNGVGIIVGDINHRITCNKLIGRSEINIQAGNSTRGADGSDPAHNALLISNIGKAVIGSGNSNVPVTNVRVENNNGTVVRQLERNTIISPTASQSCAAAVKLNINQVGPGAPQPSCLN